MKISKIEHLGIAVKSIEEALPYYEQVLGFECYNIETVEDQKVRTAFLRVGETKIELLEATSPESTIAKFIENRGEGIHHIAYKVEDGVAKAEKYFGIVITSSNISSNTFLATFSIFSFG